MTISIPSAALGCALWAAASAAALAQDTPATLPGGASSLRETFTDWEVTCTPREGTPLCALSQQQRQDNGQNVLTVELTSSDASAGARGAMLLPFGLALGKGVTLRIGEAEPGAPLPFSTCLPAGCLVPLEFDAETLAALRDAGTLTLGATVNGSDRAVNFTVSLAGFSAALERTASLSQ
ncbi:invasion associated locus B family protein [Oceanicella sp. SM1341]|uniref:invasion associated locus B family protein n=1 Tax=Oceanicella sp. SM1341 TaxID=1548889 RepID=UPI000E53C305|nr:invasion associated locus B family protein [Oceanicella sp. SM1341]